MPACLLGIVRIVQPAPIDPAPGRESLEGVFGVLGLQKFVGPSAVRAANPALPQGFAKTRTELMPHVLRQIQTGFTSSLEVV